MWVQWGVQTTPVPLRDHFPAFTWLVTVTWFQRESDSFTLLPLQLLCSQGRQPGGHYQTVADTNELKSSWSSSNTFGLRHNHVLLKDICRLKQTLFSTAFFILFSKHLKALIGLKSLLGFHLFKRPGVAPCRGRLRVFTHWRSCRIVLLKTGLSSRVTGTSGTKVKVSLKGYRQNRQRSDQHLATMR